MDPEKLEELSAALAAMSAEEKRGFVHFAFGWCQVNIPQAKPFFDALESYLEDLKTKP